ncbi:MAG: hypothetical protein NVSMB9_03590 [Isosphaeraceae bacterium]
MAQELDKSPNATNPVATGGAPKTSRIFRAEEVEDWLVSDLIGAKDFYYAALWSRTRPAVSERIKQAILYITHHGGASAHEFLTEQPQRPHPESQIREARDKQLAIITKERDEISTQNQLLQSRVSELRRASARETQRYDQLLANYSELQRECARLCERNDKLVDCLNERAKANDRLQSTLICKVESRLRMTESYEGVVEDVDGDTVLLVYDVDGKIVEQTYERSQFINGRLPDVGTRLIVYVNVAEVQLDPIESVAEEMEPRDEPALGRRKPLSGKVKF